MSRLFIALIAVSLLAVGCGKPEDKFVGTYAGSVELSQEDLEQAKVLAAQFGLDPDVELKRLESLSLTLELQDEGVFSETLNGQSVANGKWTLSEDGKSITFSDIEITGEAGKQAAIIGFDSSNVEQTFKVSEDGKALSYTSTPMGVTVTVTFTRN